MNIANNLSILRILLVPVFVASLLYWAPDKSYLHLISLGVFMLACVTDGVDGYIARKLNQKTVLGSYLDPIADKLLLLSGFISLSFMPHLPEAMRIPAWVTIAVISRDVIIVLGSTMIFMTTGTLKAEPLWIGKATTVVQMGTLLVALLGVSAPISSSLFFMTFILTVFSGVLYIRVGEKLLK